MSKESVPEPPYTPINKPTEEYITYKDATFYTEFWVCEYSFSIFSAPEFTN